MRRKQKKKRNNKKLKIILRLSVLTFFLIIAGKLVFDYAQIGIYKDVNLEMFKNSSAPKPTGKYKILDCKNINQHDGYPTGCESVSAVILLKYYGMEIDVADFISKYLDIAGIGTVDGVLTGPSPYEYYVGDPTSTSGYGCFAPVIVNALRKCLPANMSYSDSTGTSLSELCKLYIDHDIPVLVWTTVDMRPVGEGKSWTVSSTGEKFTWPAGEHCMVLVGYDESHYYFNDPYDNHGLVAYDKQACVTAHNSLGKQSVVIYKNK